MFKMTIGLAALAAATAATAAPVALNFNSSTGNLGDTHTYTASGLSVTATGYSANGTEEALYGKNGSGDEKGLGLVADPSGEHEIYYPGHDFIQLNVQNLFGLVTGASFFMGSTTDGETWKVYGSNSAGQLGTFLFGGNDESLHGLTSWGQYDFYDFVAGGTVSLSRDTNSAGNVLLAGLSLTRAVPEASTWAMMLLGFGAIGIASRRRTKPLAQLA